DRSACRPAAPGKAKLADDQWKVRPESITRVWPVIVLVRHIVTTWSATSSLSAALRSSDALRPVSTCSGRRLAVARVPSSRPGATQFTSTSGASATAMHLVRWIRPALETAEAIDEPVGPAH